MKYSNRLVVSIALFAMFAIVVTASAQTAQTFFYMEVPKEGRIYVFSNPDLYKSFQETGSLTTGMSRVGEGPNGETLYFDSEEAFHMYRFKHNLPDEVIPHAPPAAAPAAAATTTPYKFSGLMFGDYYYKSQTDDNFATFSNTQPTYPGPEKQNGFNFRRIYFTFDDQLSEKFSTRFRLEADGGSLTNNNKITVFVKDAWLYWKNAYTNGDFYFGIYPTAAYEVSENVWAFRSLDKTIMDLRGIVSSRDFQAGVRGRLDSQGRWNYWAGIGNNSGNGLELDKYKRVYLNFWGKVTPQFQFTVYYDYKAAPKIADPNNAANTVDNNANTFSLFAGYGQKDKYQLGVEAFWQNTQNGAVFGTAPLAILADKKTDGYSFWGWYYFNPKVGVVARYDDFDPNRSRLSQGDKRGYFIGSLVLKPYKTVYIMPNVQVETYEDKAGVSFKSSVTPRVTMYWTF
ncbi:MAG: hypothetical protein C5B54_00805 [Acidobacteria bacterium]|nr:MAG: hypothetical protein C5B54_00805 [Acidobacteriota bacterium]